MEPAAPKLGENYSAASSGGSTILNFLAGAFMAFFPVQTACLLHACTYSVMAMRDGPLFSCFAVAAVATSRPSST